MTKQGVCVYVYVLINYICSTLIHTLCCYYLVLSGTYVKTNIESLFRHAKKMHCFKIRSCLSKSSQRNYGSYTKVMWSNLQFYTHLDALHDLAPRHAGEHWEDANDGWQRERHRGDHAFQLHLSSVACFILALKLSKAMPPANDYVCEKAGRSSSGYSKPWFSAFHNWGRS